jgi:hypothetical protein
MSCASHTVVIAGAVSYALLEYWLGRKRPGGIGSVIELLQVVVIALVIGLALFLSRRKNER